MEHPKAREEQPQRREEYTDTCDELHDTREESFDQMVLRPNGVATKWCCDQMVLPGVSRCTLVSIYIATRRLAPATDES